MWLVSPSASPWRGCASDPRPVVVGQPMAIPSLNDYCAVAQKEIATSRVPARNVLVERLPGLLARHHPR